MKWLRGASLYGVLSAVFIFILPFVTSRHLFNGAINAKYFYIISVVSVFALIFGYLYITREKVFALKKRWLLFALGGVLLSLFLSTIFGVYPERSLFSETLRSTGVLFLCYLAFLAVWTSELLHARDWSLVRRAIGLSGALIGLLTFIGGEGLGVSGRFLGINLDIHGLTISNSTFAGVYLLISALLVLIELVRTEEKHTKYVLGVLLGFHIISPTLININLLLGNVSVREIFSSPFALLGTAQASSAVLFGIIAYVLGYVLIRRYIAQRAAPLAWAGVWLIGVVAAIALLLTPGSFVQEKIVEGSTAARPIIWTSVSEAIVERPLFGWGLENYKFAHDKYFDNRLYLDENVGEVWFDRAHNLTIDTLITTGIVGFAAAGTFILILLYTVVRARRVGLIGDFEAHVLGALVVGHIVQLQTSFDTISTYTLMALVLGYILFLERQNVPTEPVSPTVQKGAAGVLILLVLLGSWYMLFAEYGRQKAVYRVFTTDNREKQIEHIQRGLTRTSDFESIRLLSASLTRGLFGGLSREEKEKNVTIIQGSVEQLAIMGEYWKAYLEEMPDHYRARMLYAYQLLVRTAFGEGEYFDEAKAIIADSYALAPQNPLTYIVGGLAHIWSGDVEVGQEKMQEALALNPEIDLSQRMVDYANEQAASFPEITIFRLDNL